VQTGNAFGLGSPTARGVAAMTQVLAPGRLTGAAGTLEWARELTTAALREAVAALPGPERRVAAYHRGWCEADCHPDEVVAGADRSLGKAVRPALVLLGAQAVGEPPEAAVPAAVAVELVHDFTLLHDDVMDGDPLRRHRPAAWMAFGVPAAVLAGDALLVAAVKTLVTADSPSAGRAVAELSDTLTQVLEGQSSDIVFEGCAEVTADQYLSMAEGKTGSLMACACALGAVLVGAAEQRVAGLRGFGRHLGVAFQCLDDLLGIWGDSRRSGKPVGADVAARKKSLPVVAALAAQTPAGARLAELYRQPDPLSAEQVSLATKLIEEAGGRAHTEQQVQHQIRAALRCLAHAEPDSSTYQRLHELAVLMTCRDH
jgi:geranylgeranyl diphosphate synthase type I